MITYEHVFTLLKRKDEVHVKGRSTVYTFLLFSEKDVPVNYCALMRESGPD